MLGELFFKTYVRSAVNNPVVLSGQQHKQKDDKIAGSKLTPGAGATRACNKQGAAATGRTNRLYFYRHRPKHFSTCAVPPRRSFGIALPDAGPPANTHGLFERRSLARGERLCITKYGAVLLRSWLFAHETVHRNDKHRPCLN
jgi:hypothetical protein